MTTGGARANFGAPGVSNRSFCNAKTAISPPPPFLSRTPHLCTPPHQEFRGRTAGESPKGPNKKRRRLCFAVLIYTPFLTPGRVYVPVRPASDHSPPSSSSNVERERPLG